MRKIAISIAAVLLLAALPCANAEALTCGRFTVEHIEGGASVRLDGESASTALACDSFLRMVSKAYPIPFEQADDVSGLVAISKKSYQDARYGTQYIHPEALTALEALVAEAKDEGFRRTRLVETYRSIEIQQKRFDESVKKRVKQGMSDEEAYAAAHLVTALPGESEHHLGQTVDILQRGDSMGPSFGKTKFAKWLKENAPDFGFIVRYPQGMEEITGITYEPWHLRYVGKPLAEAIDDLDACMETFYTKLKADRVIMAGEDALLVYIPQGGAAAVSPSLMENARFSETGEGGGILVVEIPR